MPAYAQVNHDSLSFISWGLHKNVLFNRFDKQLNTYNLNTVLNYSGNYKDLSYQLNENYTSTIIKSVPKNIKDEHYFVFSTEYKLFDNFNLGVLTNNNILSDDRRIALNQASVFNGFVFAKYIPEDKMYVAPFFGYSNNNQIGENDFGYIYGSEALTDNISLADFNITSTMKFLNEDISPRKNTLRMFNGTASNEFSNFKNVLSLNMVQNRKDFYFSADSIVAAQFNIANNIQSRIETNYLLQDRFAFGDPYSGFSFDLTGRIQNRVIDRNTRYRSASNVSSSIFDVMVEEFRLETESGATLHSSIFDGAFRFSYSERDEKHVTKRFDESNIFYYQERLRAFNERSNIESQKNNKAQRLTLSVSGTFHLTNRDNLSFSFLQNKLTYDTPSEDNNDDRDELLSIFRLYYLRDVNPLFDAFINIEANFNHVVYIFSERSSNNNFLRLLKLATGGFFHSEVFSSKNSFEVSANYTVYDFEDINPNFHSFSFRQLSMQDSSSLRLGRHLYFSLIGSLKFSEQGDFNWESFTGKPNRNLEEFYFEPKLNYKFQGLSLGLGARMLSLNTFYYKNQIRITESTYRSLGPLAEIILNMNQRLNLRVYGWYEFIKGNDNIRRQIANLNIQMNWEL